MRLLSPTSPSSSAETVFRPAPLRAAGRGALMLGTALGCSIAILAAPDSAQAQTCSVLMPGVTECVTGPANKTITVDDGTIVPVGLPVSGDNITIKAENAAIHSNSGPAIDAVSNDFGDISISIGMIEAQGDENHGVYAVAKDGAITVVSDQIRTTGEGAMAIFAEANRDISITSTTIFVEAETGPDGDSAAINARSSNGDVTVVSGDVTTGTPTNSAEGVSGIWATADAGDVAVTSKGAITTWGDRAAGIVASADGDVTVTKGGATGVGAIRTSGNFGVGVVVSAGGNATVDIGDITTSGEYSTGLDVGGDEVVIKSGALIMSGYGSRGMAVSGSSGVTITSTTLATGGDYASGMDVYSGGDVEIVSTTLTTEGQYSDGMDVEAYGDIIITSDSLTTSGYESRGIDANAWKIPSGDGYVGGSVRITSKTLTTKGDNSDGIDVDADADAEVTSETLETHGYNAEGISVDAEGRITVTSGRLITRGENSDGIDADSDYGDVEVTSGTLETLGDDSTGIDASAYESVTVASGSLITRGDYSDGILANARGAVTITSDSVQTAGKSSRGIAAESDAGSVVITSGSVVATGGDSGNGYNNVGGIVAVANAGSITITSGSVTTGIEGVVGAAGGEAGYRATGIRAHASGDVTIDSTGTVATWGDEAMGIRTASQQGAVNVKAKTVTTAGKLSHGVVALSSGAVSVDVGTIRTSGENAIGLIASSDDDLSVKVGTIQASGVGAAGLLAYSFGDAVVQAGSVKVTGSDAIIVRALDGAVNLVVSGETASAEHSGISAAGSTMNVTVAAGGSVVGKTAGIRVGSDLGTTLNIAGSVSSTGGFAIEVEGAAATINNTGNTIIGAISLTDNDDVVNNSGSFIAAGESLFGLGNDVFNNTGVLRLLESTTPRTATFSGLETFNNRGSINLANDVVGDVLNLNGAAFNGQAGSALIVDVKGSQSDVLKVGSVTGVTTVTVNTIGKVAIGEVAVFLESAADVIGTEFVLNDKQARGLIGYDLVFDTDNDTFGVVGRASIYALDPLRFIGGAQNMWHEGADVWSNRMNQVRDTASVRPDGLEAWAQVVAGGEELDSGPRVFNAFGSDVTGDLSYDQDYVGFSTGFDIRRSGERGSTLWGLTTGLMQSELDLNSGTSAKYSGFNLGAYAGLTRDVFFLNGLVRMDAFTVDAMIPAVPVYENFDGTNWGAKVEAGARFDGGRWFAEPLARLAWVSSDLDSFSVEDGDFDYDTATSLRAELGLRLGAQFKGGAGVSIAPHLGVFAVEEMEGENEMKLTLGGATDTLVDLPGGRHGRAELGVTASAPGGLEAFAQGEALFGDDAKGFTARAGVRWRF
ncbi:Pertactin autotransporter precursor [compost metagenome]